MEVSKNEKNKQLFNVCYEEAYTPDVLKISCFSFLLLFLLDFLSKFTSIPFCTQSHNTEWPKNHYVTTYIASQASFKGV